MHSRLRSQLAISTTFEYSEDGEFSMITNNPNKQTQKSNQTNSTNSNNENNENKQQYEYVYEYEEYEEVSSNNSNNSNNNFNNFNNFNNNSNNSNNFNNSNSNDSENEYNSISDDNSYNSEDSYNSDDSEDSEDEITITNQIERRINHQNVTENVPVIFAFALTAKRHEEYPNELLPPNMSVSKSNINWRSPLDGSTVLHIASIYGKTNFVKQLLSANVNINVVTNEGNSPLLSAIKAGRTKVAVMLLKRMTDEQMFWRNEKGENALFCCVKEENEIVLEYILEKMKKIEELKKVQNEENNENENDEKSEENEDTIEEENDEDDENSFYNQINCIVFSKNRSLLYSTILILFLSINFFIKKTITISDKK